MPMASKETIDRVSNVMLNGNFLMKRALLRETPINPPHGDKSMFTSAQLSGATQHWQKLKMTEVGDMIRFIKFGAVERDHVGALTFVTKKPSELTTTASRIGWVPCWFLPWQSARILKLKISDVATSAQINFGVGIDPLPNPSLFFTAGINGCSVFAIGAASAPSLYHGGVDPGSGLAMTLNLNETTEAAWRRMLGRAHTAKFVGSVGKGDYISEFNNPAPS